jgi:hypothetical protein
MKSTICRERRNIKMIREIKPISLGSAYDFIELSKYTNNKDSIKVKFEDTGENFTKWTLSDFGLLRIESGVIDYKKYENLYRINMIVEYEPSELPLNLNEIDTLEGLQRNIIDLKSLDYIGNIRLAASRKFNIRLNEFVLFNAVLFDQFGQDMKLSYENQSEYDYLFGRNIVKLQEFKSKIVEYSYGSGAIPGANDICPHCKQKWDLHNLRDCIRRDDDLYHAECNKFSLYEKSKNEFSYIVGRVFNDYSIHAVKNEYGSEEYRGYWFIINTPDGDIKIGWRKRVIQIEWLENYKSFSFDGSGENVTKEFSIKDRYIHADNIEKAIEYLRNAKMTIVK